MNSPTWMGELTLPTYRLAGCACTHPRRSWQSKDPVQAPGERDRIKEKVHEQAQIGYEGGGERDVQPK